MTSITDDMARFATTLEAFLDAHLSNADHAVLMGTPDRLLGAMRHGTLNGGKRLRPYLVSVVAGLRGAPEEAVLTAGAALEMVHCYSLIHDDLPDMDNDTLRRGKPTVWAQYDPATAILAGDTLLTQAFHLLADAELIPDADTRIRLVQSLSFRAGATGMAGGQMLDIEGEGEARTLEQVISIHQMKTGALIEAAFEMGAIVSGETHLGAFTMAGYHAGLAFQVADDILDATADSATLGKTAGKDAAQAKATVVSVLGLEGARAMCDECVDDALERLEDFGREADGLREAIRFIATREN